ncbi:fumarylacetoacetate hydrolase family protein [Pseudomonas putida]|uniref:fumarylacetoacetate hydrolase family protein n=1 Tax=Pseudomonas putida TaxID=303 RepID=UPI001CE486FB|nr:MULTISPECIES: fumarylacetoacetate hydrolase family protein [Pseudomonas]MDZ5111361.1 fumarylacetoacetate hydrolase family protein [Pseudomonas putida]
MKLATLKDGSRDGRLLLVSRDLVSARIAQAVSTLQAAIERWDELAPLLEAEYAALNEGTLADSFPFDPAQVMAPLPRAYQFVDASAFLNHGQIMERAYDLNIKKQAGVPILVQRQGDDFRGPCEAYSFCAESENCDFEGEVAVVLDDVPMGVDAVQAGNHIKLFLLLNDVSMRAHLFRELSMGFGLINAKPATVFAPVAVTPDELGSAWRDGRVHLDLQVTRNDQWFGHPNGAEMDFSFGELIRHLAYNRKLGAGTVLASGTFSNRGYREVGSACLAERRAIEKLELGESCTAFMRHGEVLRFEMFGLDGKSVFGAIEQRFVVQESGA